MRKRGRPKSIEPTRKLTYTQEFEEFIEGKNVKSIWKYNKRKYPNGPYEVIIEYPKEYQTDSEKLEKQQAHLPLTKREYYHPVTGDLVGYTTYMKCYKDGLTNEHPKNIIP